VNVQLFVSLVNANEEHMAQVGVSICWPVWDVTVVGGCENGVSPDTLVVEARGVQWREDVHLACEQAAHTQAENFTARGCQGWVDAQENEAIARRQRFGVAE
jgi:hypothetical protein